MQVVVYFTYVATKLSKAREDFDNKLKTEGLLAGQETDEGIGSLVNELTLAAGPSIDGEQAAANVGAR
jgi:hypothetical protein